MIDRVLDVQDRSDIAADALAVFNADSRLRQGLRRGKLRLRQGLRRGTPCVAGGHVYENSQHPSWGFPPELDIEDFQTVRAGDPLGDRANPFLQVKKLRNPPSKTKSGHRPTSGLAGSYYKPRSLSYNGRRHEVIALRVHHNGVHQRAGPMTRGVCFIQIDDRIDIGRLAGEPSPQRQVVLG